jgi:hypothetical protein
MWRKKGWLGMKERPQVFEKENMMGKRGMLQQSLSLVLSGFFVIFIICLGVLAISMGVLVLGHALSYVSVAIFREHSMNAFHYSLVVLAVTCTAGLAIPIILHARTIQRSTDSFSMLQFDGDEDDEFYEDEENRTQADTQAGEEELNEFLRTLHKTRNIGPFIPSPKAMDDVCPCGSGLKYKDCCGKSWI